MIIVTQPKEAIADFVARIQGQNLPWGQYTALGLIRRERLAVGVVYNHYQPGSNICLHIAAEGKFWPTRAFLHAMFDYPFNQLKLRRVTGLIARKNKATRRFAEHLGAKLEGSMRHALPHDDLLVYGMLKRECRYLSEKYAPHALPLAA